MRRNCAHSTKPLSQTNLRDLALLLGGLAQLCRAIAVQAALEDCEHLFRALAGGANNIGEAEALFVERIARGKFRKHVSLPRSQRTIAPAATMQPILPLRVRLCVRRCADGRRRPPASRAPSSCSTRGRPLRSTPAHCQWGAGQPWPLPSAARRNRQSSRRVPWPRPLCSTHRESHSSRYSPPRRVRAEILQAGWRPRVSGIRRWSGCRRSACASASNARRAAQIVSL